MSAATSESAPGLRERKKRATRAALGRAALRLAEERGWDKVTVEAIATEADVSIRTFFNYFSSKEEAAMADTEDRIARVVAELRARPAEESVLDSMRHALVDGLDMREDNLNEWVAQLRLTRRTPSLYPYFVARQEEAERELVSVIADRTGTDPEHDLYPNLVVAVFIGAAKVAIRIWTEQRHSAPLATLISEALQQLSRGLPEPGKQN